LLVFQVLNFTLWLYIFSFKLYTFNALAAAHLFYLQTADAPLIVGSGLELSDAKKQIFKAVVDEVRKFDYACGCQIAVCR